jgi:hypothetical protein
MTKLQIKQMLLELMEASWITVWDSKGRREEVAEYLSTRFRPGSGLWEVRADQEMAVDAAQPSMQPTYVVRRGDYEPYSTRSQTEATAIAEVLNILETELRSKENPS